MVLLKRNLVGDTINPQEFLRGDATQKKLCWSFDHKANFYEATVKEKPLEELQIEVHIVEATAKKDIWGSTAQEDTFGDLQQNEGYK